MLIILMVMDPTAEVLYKEGRAMSQKKQLEILRMMLSPLALLHVAAGFEVGRTLICSELSLL